MAGRPSPSRVDRYNAVVNLLLRQAEDDAIVTTAIGRARELVNVAEGYELLELPPDQLALIGWTRTELIMAMDAKMGRTRVPFYLVAAQERHNTRIRVAQQEGPSGGEEAECYVIPVNAQPLLASVEMEQEDNE